MNNFLKCVIVRISCVAIACFSLTASAQTVYPNYTDGVVYLKMNSTDTLFPYNKNISAIATPPTYIADLVSKYDINRLDTFLLAMQLYKIYFGKIASVDQLIIDLQSKSKTSFAEKVPYNGLYIGMEDHFMQRIKINPNPATFNVTIEVTNESYAIQLSNLLGETIYSNHEISTGKKTIDVSTFPKGIYIVQVTDTENNSSGRQRLIIQ